MPGRAWTGLQGHVETVREALDTLPRVIDLRHAAVLARTEQMKGVNVRLLVLNVTCCRRQKPSWTSAGRRLGHHGACLCASCDTGVHAASGWTAGRGAAGEQSSACLCFM